MQVLRSSLSDAADGFVLRATPAFVSCSCTTLITKRGIKWCEKAWREGRGGADLWKTFHLGRWSWQNLRLLEGARCVEEVVKERGMSHSSLFPSSKANFSLLSEKQEYLRDLQSIHSDLSSCLAHSRLYWSDLSAWFRFKWLHPNHMASSASSSELDVFPETHGLGWNTAEEKCSCRYYSFTML